MRSPIVLVALVATACGGKKPAAPPSPVAADATPAATVDAAPADEPRTPPPPPTTKPGPCTVDLAPRPTRDPNPMCPIAGGTFVMGAADDDTSPVAARARPRRTVTLSAFTIDQFEVTVAQAAHFLNAAGNACPGDRRGACFDLSNDGGDSPITRVGDTYRVAQGREREPIEFSRAEGAVAYCAWAGKRLPTEAEWEFAARHDAATAHDRIYPWGDRFDRGRANCEEAACGDGFERAAPVGTFDGTGDHGDGTSPWGVHDMAGNAAELVADCYREPYLPCGDCRDPRVDEPRVPGTRCSRSERGGSWAQPGARMQTATRQPEASAGFRCAASLTRSPGT